MSVKGRIVLAVIVLTVLGSVLAGMYLYLKSVEAQLNTATQRIVQTLPSPTLPILILEPSPTPLASDSAVVKRVIDGDTVELESGQTLRYIGMDTPETHHPLKGQECFGQEASQRNRELVEGKLVRLEKDISETDRYGRLLRYVWVDDRLINQQLVEEGFALAASFPPDIAKQDIFRQAELTAKNQTHGLWASCNEMP